MALNPISNYGFHFAMSMNYLEATAWNSFAEIINKFLGNIKDDGFIDIVQHYLDSFAPLVAT